MSWGGSAHGDRPETHPYGGNDAKGREPMKVLEIVRTAALVLLALAIAWTAIHGVTFHHDGDVHIDHFGDITLDTPFGGFDVNVR